jgi:hypothetical protein
VVRILINIIFKVMGIFRRLVSQEGSEVYPFVFKITTTTANTVFTTPLADYGGLTPSLSISWGDGGANSPLITSSTSVDRIHTYVNPGTYTITISGFMPGFRVDNNAGIRNLITELVQWGIVGLRTINFYGCLNLTAIPGSTSLSGVGGYTGLADVVSFASFMRGTRITSIPEDIFDYSPNATTFTDSFSSITTITTAPSGLFDTVINATTFASCFFACTGLTSVPSTLFDTNTLAVNFSSTFRNCRALTNVLQFTNNTNVTIFNNIYNMSSTANALTGNAPELWNRIPTPSGVDAFNNCLGLSNYASIPVNFK